MPNYPGSLDDNTSLPTKSDGDDVTVAETNTQSDAIKAIESALGLPSGATAGSLFAKYFSHDHDNGDGESASVRIGAEFALKGVISPAQITADQNNYNPPNLATSSVVRLTSDALRNITGFLAGTLWKILLVENIGTFSIVLKNASTSSTAANRFSFGADLTILPGQGIILLYDGVQNRWVNPGASVTDHSLLTNVTVDQHHADVHARAKHTTAVRVSDEGGSFTDILDFDFVGAGVTATFASGKATVTIPGGAGSPATLADLQDVGVVEALDTGAPSGRVPDGRHTHAHGAGKSPDDHHNQSHSIGDHIDFDGRSISYQADQINFTGTKTAILSSNLRVCQYADAVSTVSARFGFFVPDNWASGFDVSVYWIPDTTVTGGVKWRFSYLYFAPGESANTALTNFDPTVNSATRTANIAQKETFTVPSSYAAGDFMQFNVLRLGADALDTYNGGTVQMYLVVFSYVGDQ